MEALLVNVVGKDADGLLGKGVESEVGAIAVSYDGGEQAGVLAASSMGGTPRRRMIRALPLLLPPMSKGRANGSPLLALQADPERTRVGVNVRTMSRANLSPCKGMKKGLMAETAVQFEEEEGPNEMRGGVTMPVDGPKSAER